MYGPEKSCCQKSFQIQESKVQANLNAQLNYLGNVETIMVTYFNKSFVGLLKDVLESQTIQMNTIFQTAP